MTERFVYPLRGNPDQMLKRVKREAVAHGIKFNGDTRRGAFSKSVILLGTVLSGSYVVKKNEVHVKIDVMPPGYTRAKVDQEARKLFG